MLTLDACQLCLVDEGFFLPVPRSIKLKMIGLARSLIKHEVEAPGEVILF